MMDAVMAMMLTSLTIGAASLGGIIHLHTRLSNWIKNAAVIDENHRLRIERLEKHAGLNGNTN